VGTLGAVLLVAALSYAGRAGAVVGWLAVQGALVAGWTVLSRLPSPVRVAGIVVAAALAADLVVATRFVTGPAAKGAYDASDSTLVRGAAAVVAVAFLVALLGQLIARRRARVTETLGATVAMCVVAVTAVGYVALAGVRGGRAATVAALLGVAAAVLVGRALDGLVARPSLAAGAGRGLPGAVAGLVAAALAGAAYGAVAGDLTAGGGFAIAAVAAVVAVAVDLGVASSARTAGPGGAPPVWAGAALTVAAPLLLSAAPAYVVARAALG
jgi:hypothetical protein